MGRHKGHTDKTLKMRQAAHLLKLKGLTYAEIGKMLKVSRQRAQQLVRPPEEIYKLVQAIAESKCQRCNIPIRSGHVHHKSYNDGSYSDLDELVYLCVSCHAACHTHVHPDAAKSLTRFWNNWNGKDIPTIKL